MVQRLSLRHIMIPVMELKMLTISGMEWKLNDIDTD